MPPDLLGNIDASSAWMLFCRAPSVMEMDHSTNAPVVPRAPIDPPRPAMRNAGLHRATTNPSHQVIALSSDCSSTCACATHASSSAGTRPPPVDKLDHLSGSP